MTHHDTTVARTVRLQGCVLVYSRSPRSLEQLCAVVKQQGYEAIPAATGEEAARQLAARDIAACIVDEPESPETLAALERSARDHQRPTQFVVLPSLTSRQTPPSSPVCEIVTPPHTPDRLGRALFGALGRARLFAENIELKRQLDGRMTHDLVGHSTAMTELRNRIRSAAEHAQPILIWGEPGSGATAAARAVHAARHGHQAPFLCVRCSVLSAETAREALFGRHLADGSFVPGRIEQAAGGTVLMDDVDQLPRAVQEELATFLATSGSPAVNSALPGEAARPRRHVIATLHTSPIEAAAHGTLCPKLRDQLIACVLNVPPLRDRPEDVATLTEHFLSQAASREGRPVMRLSLEGLRCLRRHHWPGNVRELENVIARCCSIESAAELTAAMVAAWIEREQSPHMEEPGLTLREMERKLIEATFTRYGGNRELTARALQIGLRTLSGKLREYGYPPRGGPGSNRIARAA